MGHALSNEDIQDILSLLDSLPYAEFTLETSRFTLQLRRSAGGGWTEETQVLPRPVPANAARPAGPREPAPGKLPPSGVPGEPAPGNPPPPGVPRASPSPGAAPSPGHPPTPGGAGAPPSSSTSLFPDTPAPPGAPLSPDGSLSPAKTAPSSGPGADVRDIVSPLPGTFYRAPQPGAPPFVEVGGPVEPGSVVAIIETMKLMNPVYAGTAGAVTEICLDDGQFAEQGTVLMRVSAGAG